MERSQKRQRNQPTCRDLSRIPEGSNRGNPGSAPGLNQDNLSHSTGTHRGNPGGARGCGHPGNRKTNCGNPSNETGPPRGIPDNKRTNREYPTNTQGNNRVAPRNPRATGTNQTTNSNPDSVLGTIPTIALSHSPQQHPMHRPREPATWTQIT